MRETYRTCTCGNQPGLEIISCCTVICLQGLQETGTQSSRQSAAPCSTITARPWIVCQSCIISRNISLSCQGSPMTTLLLDGSCARLSGHTIEHTLPPGSLPEALGLAGIAPALACFCCACCTMFLSAARASKKFNRPTVVLKVSRTAAAAAWPACPACRHRITVLKFLWFLKCPKAQLLLAELASPADDRCLSTLALRVAPGNAGHPNRAALQAWPHGLVMEETLNSEMHCSWVGWTDLCSHSAEARLGC